MIKLTTNQKGWVQAFVAILIFLGINQVMGRYSVINLQVNPILYSCFAFASCSLILIINGGSGTLAKETMRSIDTWVYGIILMFSYIFALVLFSYITATQGTLLQKIGILLSLIASFLFLGRKPDIYQSIGTAITTIGVLLVAWNITNDNKGVVLLVALLYGGFQVARFFSAELHRPHRMAAQQTKDPKAKSRVVGFVMFTVSIIFLVITFIIALAQMGQAEPIRTLPTLADFTHSPTVFAGIIAGILIVAPTRLLEFSSSNIIKAENFTAVSSLSFISVIFWEFITSPITGLSIKEITSMDMIAGGLITTGGLIIALTRRFAKKDNFKQYLKIETQNIIHIEDTRNIIANSLEHFNHDVQKVSKALNIPNDIVKHIMKDKDKSLTLNEKYLRRAGRYYRKNVAQCDGLTGLLNRTGFMTELKIASAASQNLSLLYLDLNKFKPVNDTYGHEAGDFILIEIAKKLKELFPHKAHITRLGGDEFCILLEETSKKEAQNLVNSIKNKIAEPIILDNSNKDKVSVGTSIGISNYPEDTSDPEELLTIADQSMYRSKDR